MAHRDQTVAAHLFAKQRLSSLSRSDGRTAYEHGFDVAKYLESRCGVQDPTLLITALLHDIIEDECATDKEVRRLFGDAVADGVVMLTRDGSQSGKDLLDKLIVKIEQNLSLTDMPYHIRLIKCADKYDNLSKVYLIPEGDKRYERIPMWGIELKYSLGALTAGLDESILHDLNNIVESIEKDFSAECRDIEEQLVKRWSESSEEATSMNLSLTTLTENAE